MFISMYFRKNKTAHKPVCNRCYGLHMAYHAGGPYVCRPNELQA